MEIGTILFILAAVCLVVFFCWRAGVFGEKAKSKTDLPKSDFGTNLPIEKKEKEKEVDLVEIKEFDDDEYVGDVFSSVFYSIQCDDWSREITYDKITFSRKKQFDKYNSKTISIEFEYRFESDKDYKKRVFTIKDIKLRDTGGYTSFSYKGTPRNDIKKFIYDIYAEWVNDKNKKEKEKVDKTLENIKEVLGKSSERGAKLDELLGG